MGIMSRGGICLPVTPAIEYELLVDYQNYFIFALDITLFVFGTLETF